MFSGFIGFEAISKGIEFFKEFGSEIIKVGAAAEQTKLSFNVMMGSADKGQELYGNLKKWADLTPYTHQMAYEQGKLMLSYGADSDKITKYLGMIGDVAGGSEEKFKRLSYSFSQAISTGKLTGQELREMTMAGFNPLKAIEGTGVFGGSDETKKLESELKLIQQGTGKGAMKKEQIEHLKEQIELSRGQNVEYEKMKASIKEGSFTFDMLVKAYEKATGAGGKFNNMMLIQSETYSGLASTAESYGATFQTALFDRFSPLLKDSQRFKIEMFKTLTGIFEPLKSNELINTKNDLKALFSVLESGNLTSQEHAGLIEQINSQYKDYLPKLIDEKSTLSDIYKIENDLNVVIEKKISLMVKEELVNSAKEEFKAAQKDQMEFAVLAEKAKTNSLTTWETVKYNAALVKESITHPFAAAESWINNFSSGKGLWTKESETELFEKLAGRSKGDKENALKNLGLTTLEYNKEFLRQNLHFNESTLALLTESGAQKFVDNYNSLHSKSGNKNDNINGLGLAGEGISQMGAHGGLGEAKTITINIDDFMRITANKIDSKDIEHDGNQAIEGMIRMLNNLATGSGAM